MSSRSNQVDDSQVDNPSGFSRYVEKTWLEGVYTFDRSKRITFKLPYIKQRRRLALDGEVVQQKEEGLGDLILAVPLKLYENKGDFSHNFSFTPSIKLPTGRSSGDFPISNGSWDFGASFSYSSETTAYYQLYDLYYVRDTNGRYGLRDGDEVGMDVNWGYRIYNNDSVNVGVTLILDISARYNEKGDSRSPNSSGGSRVHTGPVLVAYKDNYIFRAEYKFPAYENTIGVSLSKGQELNIGLGVVF